MSTELAPAPVVDRPLPVRLGPRPPTTRGMPHMQLGVVPDPAIVAELARRAFALPDVVERPTVVSVPGARALWLTDAAPIARPEAIVAGRELSHIHPDGSMHLPLPVERAREADAAGWAEPHPIAAALGLDGLVLAYTPRTANELDVLWSLVIESYRFVTGRDAREDATWSSAGRPSVTGRTGAD
ncbi:MAG: hypothetical protein KatS3mg065_0992 [Chloroflexota bacterium]|nr:MAG: hypothetical protein KatS3mg065_0992 [Chloroflexota bacterium]